MTIIDTTAKEFAGYSLARAIAGLNTGRPHNSFELEISNEIARKLKKTTAGLYIPSNLPAVAGERTTSGTAYGATINATQGGANLVATNVLAGSFIDVLRNKTRVVQMGATMLPGLVGNVQIPRRSAATAAYWLTSEGVDITEGEGTFDNITMTPRFIAARSQYSRQMLLQATPAIEALVRDDLAKVLAIGLDAAAISGTGANGQPLGILNNSAVTTVALGTNGAVSNLDNLLAMETAITSANADDDATAYLTNSTVVGGWKTLKDTTGRYLWTDNNGAALYGKPNALPGFVNGYPVYRSNQVPNTLTKGSGTGLSGIVMGTWSDLIIGEWGVLEILPNPYGAGFNSGSVDIRAMLSANIGLRHNASFSKIVDAIQ